MKKNVKKIIKMSARSDEQCTLQNTEIITTAPIKKTTEIQASWTA